MEVLAPVLDGAWRGLVLVLSWPNPVYLLLATMAAMVVAGLPGVSAITLLVLAVPLTFSWELEPALVVFGALVGGGTFMGSVTAILFNIPGTAPNAATAIDGHAMTQQGRAKEAIACSAAASALGSSVGIAVVVLLLPVVSSVLHLVGPAEMVVLTVWGLLTVATVIRTIPVKGFILVGLGLMGSFVGLDPISGEARYTFGTLYLLDGIPLIPAFIGIFAVAETIELVSSRRHRVAERIGSEGLGGSAIDGVLAVFRFPGVFLRSSLIGTMVGVIPGIGGTAASFIAYNEARRTAGETGRFGKGDVRGVLAPEATNDAKDGGSLLTTLALGIPGSAGTAVLLTGLEVHGLQMGPGLLQNDLDLVFGLLWALFLSNWITSLLGLALAGRMAGLATVRSVQFVPVVLVFAAVGAMGYRARLADVFVAFAFGIAGYGMRRYGWPRIAFVMALILGPLLEVNLTLTMRLQELGRLGFWTRPSVLVGAALVMGTLILPRLLSHRRTPR